MQHPTVKILLCGNGSVGKSSIIQRLVADGFDRVYRQTIGCDFFEKVISIKGDSTVNLQVWDIGGQSIASHMLNKYIEGSSIIMLCYDITDIQSFYDLEDWWSRVGRRGSTSYYLIGNKMDLQESRQVTEGQHIKWLENHSSAQGGFHISARNGENVSRVFYSVTAKAIGVTLTDYDLEFLSQIIVAEGTRSGNDETRTSDADRIEAEDLALEAAKENTQCTCLIA